MPEQSCGRLAIHATTEQAVRLDRRAFSSKYVVWASLKSHLGLAMMGSIGDDLPGPGASKCPIVNSLSTRRAGVEQRTFVICTESTMTYKKYRARLTHEVLDGLLHKLWLTEPYPCGIRAILDASTELSDLALLCCHYGLRQRLMRTHQKLCSHMVECIPDGACEKEMLVAIAHMLCRVENIHKEYCDEHVENPDN